MHEARNMHSIECRRKGQKALVHSILAEMEREYQRKATLFLHSHILAYKMICNNQNPQNNLPRDRELKIDVTNGYRMRFTAVVKRLLASRAFTSAS